MKLMTLNTHSLSETEGERKAAILADFLRRERPDGVALQEVCQSREASVTEIPAGMTVAGEEGIPLRQDNYLLTLYRALSEEYFFCWLPVKIGYGTRDEGLGFLSRRPFTETRAIPLTPSRPYGDWRRRGALGVRREGSHAEWICLHTDWWEEGFLEEWALLRAVCCKGETWLLGDFNVSAERLVREGDPLRRDGFFDTYALAKERDLGDTVLPQADGWWGRERQDGLRIDQIRCRPSVPIKRYRRVLDGREDPMVSDHFGVMIETEEGFR